MIKITAIIIIGFFLINGLNSTVLSCTVFHVSNENLVFGGNNEDWTDPDTYIYFLPPTEELYGKAIVGYSGNYWIQGGVNEHGLFWDGLAAPYLEVLNSTGKPYFNGHIFDYILSVCDTCDEAIDILGQYNMKILERAQILMGDRYGDSFIIEGDIIHRKSDYFQLCTNFYLSQYPNPPFPCWRYNTALDIFQSSSIDDLSVDFCASVLDAVHQVGAYPTQYSNVYDLKNGLIYLYYYHDYDNVVILNLSEEFELGFHSYSIPSLFINNSESPSKPLKPYGTNNGKYGVEYFYQTSSIDPNNDNIFYLFEWGDSSEEIWYGPYESGITINVSHIWNSKGEFFVRVKARDEFGAESEWSDPLIVSMPKSINIFNQVPRIILWLFERFPFLQSYFHFL